MLRTQTCGDLRAADEGREVTLAGWVHTRRDHGALTFIDLRDRYGLTQVVAHRAENAAAHEVLGRVRNEWVLQVRGTVRPRPQGTTNPKLATGEVEVVATSVEILNESKTPPFYVNEDVEVDEMLRWRYRYVDLRRERSRDLMRLRHEVVDFIRRFFVDRGFWDIETTLLIKSDPTGARDFVVPSRYYPGKFWALPQSPQQLKQILMVGGIDKYVQIARCFRDEDPRADRSYEFTQLDVEMSFVEPDDVMGLAEECYTRVFERFGKRPLARTPWPRMKYADAMRRFGTDRPDTRFGMELLDLTDVFRGTGFNAFREPVGRGGVVRGMVVPGKKDATRKDIDRWTGIAKTRGAKGLAHFTFAAFEVSSPVAKFLTAAELGALRAAAGAKDGDILVAVADEHEVASEALGALRSHLGEALRLVDASTHHALWIVDFPLFKKTPEGGWTFSHNPFVSPRSDEDVALLGSDPGKAMSKQYDMVVDGREMGGGSVRIHKRSVQERVFEVMGAPKEESAVRFAGFLDALDHGAPPHGGIAPGIDRLIMTLAGTENIREVIAFPKTQTGYDPMLEAPAAVDEGLLEELGLRVTKPPRET